MTTMSGGGRRDLLKGGSMLGLGLAAGTGAAVAQPAGGAGPGANRGAGVSPPSRGDAAMRRPLPAQKPATQAVARLGDVGLAYWDTGGSGQPVILLHPGTGSHAIWGYQQPVLVEAGYRVISYSRRGYLGSESGPAGDPGGSADDLERLADFLKIDKFHAVGCAAGAIVGADFALSRPNRLHSLVAACTHMGITDPDYVKMSTGLRPKGFNEMPSEFREVGPSYRAANPEGTAQWVELEHKAQSGPRINQRPTSRITFAALREMKIPTLLIGGDADLWAPPAVFRMFAEALPNNELLIIPESGHSAYWEQPDIFNEAVLAFLAKHKPA